MATGIFCSVAEVERKAGSNANATSVAEAYVDDYTTQAESEINVATQFNWSDAYSGLDVDVKAILKEAASNLAAMYVIQYDMSGFTTLREAETMLDVLESGYLRALSLLRDVKKRDFMNDA